MCYCFHLRFSEVTCFPKPSFLVDASYPNVRPHKNVLGRPSDGAGFFLVFQRFQTFGAVCDLTFRLLAWATRLQRKLKN